MNCLLSMVIYFRLRFMRKECLQPVILSFITMVFLLVATIIVAVPALFANEPLVEAVPNHKVDNYTIADQIYVTFSKDHVHFLDAEDTVQIRLDSISGSGFASKNMFLYGSISMQIKLVPGDSAGTVTAYYLSSEINDEFDFEFLGNVSGQPYILQTNVYANGTSGREQRIYLWFDPTTEFHTYSFIWTNHHTVFYVDSTPIRIFANNESSLGVPYISRPMRLYTSIWNGDYWATRRGKDKIDWNHAPFVATFRNFKTDACVWREGRNSSSAAAAASPCGRGRSSSKEQWLNQPAAHQALTPEQLYRYNLIQSNYTVYDYCKDFARYPILPAECNVNPRDISNFSTVSVA